MGDFPRKGTAQPKGWHNHSRCRLTGVIGSLHMIEAELEAGASGPDDLGVQLDRLHGSAWQSERFGKSVGVRCQINHRHKNIPYHLTMEQLFLRRSQPMPANSSPSERSSAPTRIDLGAKAQSEVVSSMCACVRVLGARPFLCVRYALKVRSNGSIRFGPGCCHLAADQADDENPELRRSSHRLAILL